ncbi:MAG TPA: DNA adenine methylase [Spirochaetota bacterium]|nr:DNA adenine methylase [Spirochaetota bacterium]HOL56676.1 DNA adenine methylase [Spirochaetota bacterium]HPP03312.1 DNA adenine methylase [Spirochaetota bacterium]
MLEQYLQNHLIAYIGNKRRLLSLIEKAIEKTDFKGKKAKFLDLFAGSGAVSRLAKSLGFEVYCNDWEYYSYIINRAFIELDKDFLDNSFKNFGGIDNVLNILNKLKSPKEKDCYISKYYCPKNDQNPDLEKERMFWTNYNGKKIDAIRAKIEEWKNNNEINENEETLLLALLLYEASTRSNTSGVFKAFHRGFGGTNGDALSRILKEVELTVPCLINGEKCYVFKEDAVELSFMLRNIQFDIVYLDPPYNQHQYGSNYHLLNTIALNDKPLVNENITINGKKINKSAIRKDWIKTKSTFCYAKSAKQDFEKILNNINSKYILISYSTDGIIPFEDMLEILSNKGKLDIVLSEYTKYRGGKQALTTEVRNIEFVLFVDTSKKSDSNDIINVQKTILINKIKLMAKKTINLVRAETVGFEKDYSKKFGEIYFSKKYDDLILDFYLFQNKIKNISVLNNLFSYDLNTISKIYEDFEFITNLTKEDELYIIISDIVKYYINKDYENAYDAFAEIPYLLSKFNNKKAYIQSLKAIEKVLHTIIETKDIWDNLLENKNFYMLEKIILKKLNYSEQNSSEVIQLKERIGALYDEIVEFFERKSKEYQKVSILLENKKILRRG